MRFTPGRVRQFLAGIGTAMFSPGGLINAQQSLAGIGNGADAADHVLFTYTLPANTLAVDGQSLLVRAFVNTGANANSKTTKLHFGGTVVVSDTSTNSAQALIVTMHIVRTGAATQLAFGFRTRGTAGSSTVVVLPTETLSGAIVIKVTGASAASAANDVVGHAMTVAFGH